MTDPSCNLHLMEYYGLNVNDIPDEPYQVCIFIIIFQF